MVIPLGDENPTRRLPVVTWLFVAVNVGVFVVGQPWTQGPCAQAQFFLEWAAVPAEVMQGEPLDADGIRAAPLGERCDLDPQPDKPVYAAILFSLFLHGDWFHLGFNMLYLAIFGNNVEDRYGHLRFLVFYLTTGFLATVAFVIPNLGSPVPLVGASGAIAGVLGAYLVLFPGARVTVSVPLLLFLVVQLPAAVVLGFWFVGQLLELRASDVVAGGGVAYLAHVAGFVAGLGITLLLGFRPRRPHRHPRRRRRRRRVERGWADEGW